MVTREELYELVWSKPMLKVAEHFQVSSSYLARVCMALNVPRPERGYWAKMAVGKAPIQDPLPDARPGDVLSWTRDGKLPTLPKRSYTPAPRERVVRTRITKATVHELVSGAREHFDSGRPVDEGAYLKPYKKLLVDVTTSRACLDRSLTFANELFLKLESCGHRVRIAAPDQNCTRIAIDEREQPEKQRDYYHSGLWSPCRPTVVYVGTVPIGLAIVEMSEKILMRYVGNGRYIREADYVSPKRSRYTADHTWTTTKEIPSGRQKLIAYCPYSKVSWMQEWRESRGSPLGKRIPEIIKHIENASVDLVPKLEEADRQAEIKRREWLAAQERWRREEDRRKVEQSVKDSREDLERVIQRWSYIVGVEQFLQSVERRAIDLAPDERTQVTDRLNMVREFLGTQDPFEFLMTWRTPQEYYQPRYPEWKSDSPKT